MIRNRLGVITAGAGGNAGSYAFDPSTGLSSDPKLAYYLQDLTPAQLQTALDGQSPSADLVSLFNQAITGTGAGALPCGSADSSDPTCTGGGMPTTNTNTWLIAGAAALILLLLVTHK
jgi:hypothetical protein